MAAFLDTGGTMACARSAQLFRIAVDQTATAATSLSMAMERLRDSLREAVRVIVHEVYFPKNARWFHAFARRVESVRAPSAEPFRASPRRALHGFPEAQRRARKRRAWIIAMAGE